MSLSLCVLRDGWMRSMLQEMGHSDSGERGDFVGCVHFGEERVGAGADWRLRGVGRSIDLGRGGFVGCVHAGEERVGSGAGWALRKL